VEHWLKPESTEIVRGRTGLITGTLELDPLVQPPTVTVSIITVNVAGLTTHDRDLDAALRDTYLQSKTFPLATFTPRQILDLPTTCAEDKPVTFRLVGDLTIRTIVKPVEFTVTAQLTGDTITGEARALLRMTSFGITPPSKTGLSWVENEVTVICTFVARTAPL
jgi:polyisoprenoid-binding protein YceI